MSGSLFVVDVYGIIFSYLDGANLARWMQTCKRLYEFISNRQDLLLRVRMRISYCETLPEILFAITHDRSVAGFSKRPGQNIQAKKQMERLFKQEPWNNFRLYGDGFRYIKSTDGDFTYLISDSYHVEGTFLNTGLYLERRFPDRFRVMCMALFARCDGFCIGDYKDHVNAGTEGKCCEMEVHRGYICVLRFTNYVKGGEPLPKKLKRWPDECILLDTNSPFDYSDYSTTLYEWKSMMDHIHLSGTITVVLHTNKKKERYVFPLLTTISEFKAAAGLHSSVVLRMRAYHGTFYDDMSFLDIYKSRERYSFLEFSV